MGFSFQAASLRTRFNVAMTLVFLVIAAASVLFFDRLTTDILDALARRAVIKEALLERARIASAIDREVALAQSLAADPVLLRFAAREDDPEAGVAAMAQLGHYRKLFRDRLSYFAVTGSGSYFILHKDADNARPAVRVMSPSDPADRWYFSTLAEVDGFALNLDYDALIRDTKVWINAVGYGPDGRKAVLAGTGLDISAFVRGIVGGAEAGIASTLVDKNGVIMAHPDAALMEHNGKAPDERKITLYAKLDRREDVSRVGQALAELSRGAGEEVRAFPIQTREGRAYMAVTALPGLGWYDVVTVDVDGLLGAKTFWPMILLLMAALTLVILSVTALMGRMVLGPLFRLNQAARDMAAGRFSQNLDVTGNDEISQLTGSFNAMSAQVHDTTANLEAKVAERTRELKDANSALRASRQRLMESITYASSIQKAILPKDEAMAALFAEYSVLYRPRDIVGGDLYYLRALDEHVLFAVLDCTGHGVPGALMTMTAHSVLNHVLSQPGREDPVRVLQHTDRELREAFRLHEAGAGSLDCGLDMAVCVWHPATGRLRFAGAGLSLFALANDGLREIRGDRKRLGYRGAYQDHLFTSHELSVRGDERFYLVTDGFLDEGGGPKGFGFGQPRFEDMLKTHARVPLAEQAALFEAILTAYRGERAQRDDITLLGFSLPRPRSQA